MYCAHRLLAQSADGRKVWQCCTASGLIQRRGSSLWSAGRAQALALAISIIEVFTGSLSQHVVVALATLAMQSYSTVYRHL